MLPRLSDPAVHAACSFENESLSSPECEQGALLPLQASGPGPKIPEVLVKLPVAYPNFTLCPARRNFLFLLISFVSIHGCIFTLGNALVLLPTLTPAQMSVHPVLLTENPQ